MRTMAVIALERGSVFFTAVQELHVKHRSVGIILNELGSDAEMFLILHRD